MNQRESKWQLTLRTLSVLCLIAFVATIYYPGLSGSFIFDDTTNVVENAAIQMESPTLAEFAEAATAYGGRAPHRPVATISLAVDHWIWSGDAFGFKLTNVVLHLLTTLMLLLLAHKLFLLQRGRCRVRAPFWAAFAVAALWAVHPLQVSTVLYVVQRMEMLAALFVVLSLLAYIAGRQRLETAENGGWFLLGIAAFSTLLALLSKETGVLAPFFMLAVELLVFRFRAESGQAARILKVGFAAVVAAALLVYLVWLVPEHIFGDHFVKREFSWDERLLTQLRVLPMYVGWALFPAIDQYLFYYDHFAHSQGLMSPATTLLGAVLLAFFLVTAWMTRNRAPLVALGIIWFFTSHALTSNIFSLELVFEHRNYFSLFGVVLSVAAGLASIDPLTHRLRSAPVIVAVLVLGLGLLTAIRSATWGDEMTLALHHVHVNPDSERAGLDLAELYLGNENWDPAGSLFLSSARSQLERVAALPTARTTADQALIVLNAQSGEPAPEGAWERLLQKVRSRALNSADYDALYNLVQQRYQGVPISDEWLWQLHSALCQRSDIPPQIHARFGYYAALVLNDSVRATSAFRRALELLSEDPGERQSLKVALKNAGVDLMGDVTACGDA